MDTTPVTVGTAGHIDHGKTLLVERLTGMRADRPYERERGMTIDIGYAEMRTEDGRRIGFVDLPGHERFVRNMVAGATGIDLALLVVAADDGVMPQTREHVDILSLLGVKRVLVVLNKIDAVDAETRELAKEELREFLDGTWLKGAEILPCSAATGEGVDALRAKILALVAETTATDDPRAFFLAVQRTFAAAGFGCIATGVPAAGTVRTGDELELLPAGRRVRVRAIEIYHEPAEAARAGHRTALNLANIHHDEVGRGMVVATPGVFRATRHVVVDLTLLAGERRALRHAARARFLTGTLEAMATVHLLDRNALAPGESALAEIRTAEPVTVLDGAAFILRSDNAADTVGGGRIVAAADEAVRRKDTARQEALRRWAEALGDPVRRLRLALELEGASGAGDLAARARLDRDAATRLLEGMRARGDLAILPNGAYVEATAVARAAQAVRNALETLHRENPLVAALAVADVRDRAQVPESLVEAALARLGDAVEVDGRNVRLAGFKVDLDPELSRAADRLLKCLADGRFAPPEAPKLASASGLDAATVRRALTFLRDRREVRDVAPDLVYSKRVLDEGLRLLKAVAVKRGSFEPVDAKAVLGGISRKWLIPLLEYYDKLGATRRDGNARLFTRKGEVMAERGIDAT
ncbi:MAG TPA: selenocysteine-specific translation elongation factor [Planctomycetota bacterium]|nr:selenocysteine-specific translation elongation factor [Planctomycetota bacterium]